MRFTESTLVLALLVASSLTAFPTGSANDGSGSDPAVDGVTRYVEPRYNGIADGETVVIEVQVLPDGTVQGTKIVSAPFPIVGHWAEDAAEQWEFEPDAGGLPTTREIRFTLNSVHTDSPRGVRSHYESPLTLHVEYVEPSVEFLKRVGGKIPVKYCEKHNEPMEVRLLPIRYGLWMYTEDRANELKPYWKAKRRLFPNAHLVARRGDIRSSEVEAETYVCSSCMQARTEWIAKHPKRQVEKD
jgi:TonB family protein